MKSRVAFIDIGRSLAALLVVYVHIDSIYLKDNKGVDTWLTRAVDAVFTTPLKLGDQGIGAIAVPFFFLASGFVVTPIALRLGAGRFATNRVFRIYPPLIFAVLLAAGIIMLGSHPLSTNPQPITFGSVLSNISLVNFLQSPLGAYVGVAWTLLVEVLFYGLLIALLPVLRRSMWLTIAIELELVHVMLMTHALFGVEYRALAVNVVYLTMPIMGQVIWAAWTRTISPAVASVFLLIAWGLFVWAGNLTIHPSYIPRPFPVGFALALFLLGLFAENRLKQRRGWTELSERTYSIYLLHGVIAFPVLHLTYGRIPLDLALLLAVLATAVGVEIGYRLVELPSHRVGRALSRRGRAPRAAVEGRSGSGPESHPRGAPRAPEAAGAHRARRAGAAGDSSGPPTPRQRRGETPSGDVSAGELTTEIPRVSSPERPRRAVRTSESAAER